MDNELRELIGDSFVFAECLGSLEDFLLSSVSLSYEAIRMHRLMQVVVRNGLIEDQQRWFARNSVALSLDVFSEFPDDDLATARFFYSQVVPRPGSFREDVNGAADLLFRMAIFHEEEDDLLSAVDFCTRSISISHTFRDVKATLDNAEWRLAVMLELLNRPDEACVIGATC